MEPQFPLHLRLVTRALHSIDDPSPAVREALSGLRALAVATTESIAYPPAVSEAVRGCAERLRFLADTDVFGALDSDDVVRLNDELADTHQAQRQLTEDYALVEAAAKTLTARLIERHRAAHPHLACGIEAQRTDQLRLDRIGERRRDIPYLAIASGAAGAIAVGLAHALLLRRMSQ